MTTRLSRERARERSALDHLHTSATELAAIREQGHGGCRDRDRVGGTTSGVDVETSAPPRSRRRPGLSTAATRGGATAPAPRAHRSSCARVGAALGPPSFAGVGARRFVGGAATRRPPTRRPTRCSRSAPRRARPEPGLALHAGVVGIASDPAARGYWLVGADGGVFAFGNARVLRLGRRRAARTRRSSASRPPRTAAATGSSATTAACSRSATPASTARPPALPLDRADRRDRPDPQRPRLLARRRRRRRVRLRRRALPRLGRRASISRSPIVGAAATTRRPRLLARRRRRRRVRLRRRALPRLASPTRSTRRSASRPRPTVTATGSPTPTAASRGFGDARRRATPTPIDASGAAPRHGRHRGQRPRRLLAGGGRGDPTSSIAERSVPRVHRAHESDSAGGYQAVSAGGTYRGAYQFDQATWNSAARLAGRARPGGRRPRHGRAGRPGPRRDHLFHAARRRSRGAAAAAALERDRS